MITYIKSATRLFSLSANILLWNNSILFWFFSMYHMSIFSHWNPFSYIYRKNHPSLPGPLDSTGRITITSCIKPTGRVVAQHTLRTFHLWSEGDGVRTRAHWLEDELCTSQFELQYHFKTQQSIPNTILALLEVS